MPPSVVGSIASNKESAGSFGPLLQVGGALPFALELCALWESCWTTNYQKLRNDAQLGGA